MFSTLLLGMYLWYRCLDAVSGGDGRLERNARFWALSWLLLQFWCILVPPLFGLDGWSVEAILRSFLFAFPCLLLYVVPVISAEPCSALDGPSPNY